MASTPTSLRAWIFVTALIHLGTAGVFFFASGHGSADFTPVWSFAVWAPSTEGCSGASLQVATPMPGFVSCAGQHADTATLSLRTLLIVFPLLSAGAQLAVLARGPAVLLALSSQGAQALVFLEYSISAPLMVVAIGLVLGIVDAALLVLLAVLTSVGCLCGLCVDLAMLHDPVHYSRAASEPRAGRSDAAVPALEATLAHQLPVVLHGIGWLCHGAVWVILLQIYAKASAATPPPAFVNTVVASMAILFALFGLVQLAQLVSARCTTRAYGHYPVLAAYTTLSAVAKTLLCYLVGAQLFL